MQLVHQHRIHACCPTTQHGTAVADPAYLHATSDRRGMIAEACDTAADKLA